MESAVELFHMSVMCYGVGMIPALRGMSNETLDALILQARAESLVHPLDMCPEAQFVLPTNGSTKLTGAEVTAILVFGLWVRWGENESQQMGLGTPEESLAGMLLSDWPEINEALLLAQETA